MVTAAQVAAFKRIREGLMNNGAADDTKRMPEKIHPNQEPTVLKKTAHSEGTIKGV